MPDRRAEPSRLSLTLLQNYLLTISLMKNIALTFASTSLEEYNQNIKDQIKKMREVENRLPNATEFGISYLVVQHKKEVIDVYQDYHRVLKETFSAEFLSMLRMCLFVPFIHESTPLPENMPACEEGQHLPDIEEVKEFMAQRLKIVEMQEQLLKRASRLRNIPRERNRIVNEALE